MRGRASHEGRRWVMSVIIDIIAVELMELSRRMNPLWFIRFEDIYALTARQ